MRVVAAMNKDLAAMCQQRTFREDLHYRLNVVTIHLPPLREREGDVEHLVRFPLAAASEELGREVAIEPAALTALEAWRWPGNVRELENELQRAAVFADGAIRVQDLSSHLRVN